MSPLLVALLAAAAWYWWRRPAGPSLTEARAILEIGEDADADAVRAAYRRLIVRVHPDHGGSADLARRVTAARDTLLTELNRKASRTS